MIFSDSDPAEGQCVETGRVKFVYFVGKPDEPDILEKLMMKGDLPVFKKDSHQRYPSSDATLLTIAHHNLYHSVYQAIQGHQTSSCILIRPICPAFTAIYAAPYTMSD